MTQLVKCAEFIHHRKYKIVIFIDDLDRIREEKVSLSSTWGAGTYFNTRITVFSTYLKLPRAVKMTDCSVTKKCLIIRHFLCHKFLSTFVLNLVMS